MQQLKTMFRNGSIALAAAVSASPVFAADSLLDTATTGMITQAQTDGGSVAKLIIGALVVVAALGIIAAVMRKA